LTVDVYITDDGGDGDYDRDDGWFVISFTMLYQVFCLCNDVGVTLMN
jgi:hypothetical protein